MLRNKNSLGCRCLLPCSLTVLLAGCWTIGDGWCVNMQDVLVEITETASGKSVANARVIYQRLTPEGLIFSPDPVLTADADQSLSEGETSTTNSDGRAMLPLLYGVLPPPWPLHCAINTQDGVTGARYRLRVETDSASELFSLDFAPGATVLGENFTITVVSIGSPISVPP